MRIDQATIPGSKQACVTERRQVTGRQGAVVFLTVTVNYCQTFTHVHCSHRFTDRDQPWFELVSRNSDKEEEEEAKAFSHEMQFSRQRARQEFTSC